MANVQLESFFAQVKADPALLRQLQACPNLDAIASLGASLGFAFTGVDLVRHQAEATLRLGDDDLAAAAAGVELEGHLWLMRIVWG
jgi:predicted ribosomally synthesized peptide with nif11-like leader